MWKYDIKYGINIMFKDARNSNDFLYKLWEIMALLFDIGKYKEYYKNNINIIYLYQKTKEEEKE